MFYPQAVFLGIIKVLFILSSNFLCCAPNSSGLTGRSPRLISAPATDLYYNSPVALAAYSPQETPPPPVVQYPAVQPVRYPPEPAYPPPLSVETVSEGGGLNINFDSCNCKFGKLGKD
jgi:hypothetical protein